MSTFPSLPASPPPPLEEGDFSVLPADSVWEIAQLLALPDLLSLMGASRGLDALVRQTPIPARALELGDGCQRLLALVRRGGARLPFITALRVVGGAPPLGLALESVFYLPALRTVALRGHHLSPSAARALEALPHVEFLDLSHCSFGTRQWRAPVWAATIRALHISHARDAVEWLRVALALPRLAELSLGPFSLEAGIEALTTRCHALVALVLEGVSLSATVLAVSAEPWRAVFSRLRSLSLLSCDLHPPAHLQGHTPPPLMEVLRSAPSLEALRVVDPQSREWAGGPFFLDKALLWQLGGVWPRGLRALALSPGAHFCDDAAEALVAMSPRLEALQLGLEERVGGALALSDRGASALLRRLPLRALGLPWCPRLRDPPLGCLPHLQRASFAGCAALCGGALAALLAGGSLMEELRVTGCHGAAEGNAVGLAALAARGCVVAYAPRAPPPPATPRYLFGDNGGAAGAGRLEKPPRAGLLRGWFFENGVPPPPIPRHQARAHLRAGAPGTQPLLGELPRTAPPPDFSSPSAACAAAATATAAREAAALFLAACPCPLQWRGCAFVAAPQPGGATARGGAIAHLRSGACAYASFACLACGAEVGPTGLCGAPACATVAPYHACMPHVEGDRRAALARGETPRQPPEGVARRGIRIA